VLHPTAQVPSCFVAAAAAAAVVIIIIVFVFVVLLVLSRVFFPFNFCL